MQFLIIDYLRLTFRKVKCLFLGHKFKYAGRENGVVWGWNYYTCKRCGKEIDDYEQLMYTIIEIEYWEEKDGIMQWVLHQNYYWGDISNIDIETDWRTSDVKGKRRNAKILGLCDTIQELL